MLTLLAVSARLAGLAARGGRPTGAALASLATCETVATVAPVATIAIVQERNAIAALSSVAAGTPLLTVPPGLAGKSIGAICARLLGFDGNRHRDQKYRCKNTTKHLHLPESGPNARASGSAPRKQLDPPPPSH
jgi:hypothetical protein